MWLRVAELQLSLGEQLSTCLTLRSCAFPTLRSRCLARLGYEAKS